MYSLPRQGQSNNYFNLIQLSYDLTYSDVTYFNIRTDKKNIDFLNKITRIRLRLTLFRTPSPRRSEKYITDESSDLKKGEKKNRIAGFLEFRTVKGQETAKLIPIFLLCLLNFRMKKKFMCVVFPKRRNGPTVPARVKIGQGKAATQT